MGKGRAPCCDKSKVRTGPWSPAEDLRLVNFIRRHGHSNWRALPKQAGLLRCGKSCRLRWINYLRPDVKRGNFTPEEEQTIIELHNSIGKKWSKIAACLPGRTDNEIKNVWNTHLKKKLTLCQQTQPKHHSKMDDNYVSSSSCTSSSISTIGDQNLEILLNDDQAVQETNDHLKKPNDEPTQEFLIDNHGKKGDISSDLDIECLWEMLDTNIDDNLQQSNKTEEIIREVQNTDHDLSMFVEDGNIDIDSEIELTKWLRFFENELGLTSHDDGDHTHDIPTDRHTVVDDTSTQMDQENINFQQEYISPPALDYFPIWPCSPYDLGF